MKKKKMINMLRLMLNTLSDKSSEFAQSIQAAIIEAENSESEVDIDELVKMVEGVITQFKAQEEKVEEVIENKINKFKVEFANEFSKKKEKENYLKTKNALSDYVQCIRNSKSGAEATEKWKAKLIENGITGLVFPTEIQEGIQTKWEENKGLFSAIRKVSNRNFKILYTDQAKTDLDVRAKGHAKGALKTAQSLVVQNKEITMQAIYKDLPLDRIDAIQLDDNGALVNWIIDELAFMLTYELERSILIGDGRAGGHADKVSSFESIATKSATDAWTLVMSRTANKTLKQDLKTALDVLIDKGLDVWVFLPKAKISEMQEFQYATGGTIDYRAISELESQLGVAAIKDFDLGAGVEAVIIIPDLYFRVGGEMFGEQWTIYEKNQEAFRSEIFAGGKIAGLLSTAVIKTAGGE